MKHVPVLELLLCKVKSWESWNFKILDSENLKRLETWKGMTYESKNLKIRQLKRVIPGKKKSSFRAFATRAKKSNWEDLIFVNFYIIKLCLFFQNLNSSWKMCSFEAHNVDVTKKSAAWQGPQRGTIQQKWQ